MIVKTEVNGRPALVVYLNDRFQPVDEVEALFAKVRFTDDEGGVVFLEMKPADETTRSG